MASSVEAKIIDGLFNHFNGVTLPTGATIAYPNVDFSPPTTTSGGKTVPAAYVRLSIHRNVPRQEFIKANREPIRMGLMMATVCWPKGEGINQAYELAGQIRDHYAFDDTRSDRRIVNYQGIRIYIGIEQAVTVNDDMQGTEYTEIPVIIPWTVYP